MYQSVQEVTKAVEEVSPDIVAVELCPARYRALTGQEEEKEIKISELLSGQEIYILLVQMFLAYIQKKIGDRWVSNRVQRCWRPSRLLGRPEPGSLW
jgi:pheromone shutdown protein TraB